ncbi:MAG: 50S ribosomal protein L25/general stress protein Ctc [Bacteroidales bacterium]|nr:50S ribosomal protein L25/general stress protein Ctc [Bacteroidales bacterium]
MKSLEIKGTLRKELGKKETKKLRKENMVPCVMYGGENNVHFYAHENLFKDLVYTPKVFLVDLNLDGDKYVAILKEIQFHPVTDKIIHIDFIQIFDDKPATVKIPIELTGSSIGLKNGGKLRQRRRTLKVKGLVADLPDTLNIDISDVNIGDMVKVGDVKFKNLEILDPSRSMVVGVVSSRLAAKGMGAEEEGAEEVAAEAGAEETTEEAKEE